jgi:putative transposase
LDYFFDLSDRKKNKRKPVAPLAEKIGENDYARIVRDCWNDLPNHYVHVQLDEFVIMPNHIHGIIILREIPMVIDTKGSSIIPQTDSHIIGGAGFKPAPARHHQSTPTPIDQDPSHTACPKPSKRHGLPEIVRVFKTFSSRRINEFGLKFKWQGGYFDRIIRSEKALFLIRKYIQENPQRWEKGRK